MEKDTTYNGDRLPDDHVSTSELMQEISPEKWETYQEMCRRDKETEGRGMNMDQFVAVLNKDYEE